MRRSFWYCNCDCGQTSLHRESQLLNGSAVSCGCLKGQRVKQHTPEVSALLDSWGKAKVWRYYQYKQGAASRGYSFNIDEKLFHELTQKCCYYCGRDSQNTAKVPSRDTSNKRSAPCAYTGLDRVDNTQGYEPDNVVPCCADCNRAKRCMPQEDFLSLIEQIYKLHFLKASHATS